MCPSPSSSWSFVLERGLARYTPLARVGTGGMGEVWRAEALFPDGRKEQVAIKRVLPRLAASARYRQMLEDEARLGRLLKHPNIVRVYDAREQGSFMLVMEYVEGRSLRDLLAVHLTQNRPVQTAVSLYVARAVARALAYAHAAQDELGRDLRLVHGDVSPHNILLSSRGEVKLMDFGLSDSLIHAVSRKPEKLSGKIGYFAPERALSQDVSQLNDVFGLGIVLWECLTGRRLFPARSVAENRGMLRCAQVPPPSAFNPQVDAGLDALVLKALASRKEERFASAHDLGEALDAQLAPFASNGGGRALVEWASGCAKVQAPLPAAEVDSSFDSLLALADTTVFERALLKLPDLQFRG